jgi:hypothetical protein
MLLLLLQLREKKNKDKRAILDDPDSRPKTRQIRAFESLERVFLCLAYPFLYHTPSVLLLKSLLVSLHLVELLEESYF